MASLTTIPDELLLQISALLDDQCDRARLARVCKRLREIFNGELFDHDARLDDKHALWHACVRGDLALLRRVLRHHEPSTAILINAPFKTNHYTRLRQIWGDSSESLTPLEIAIKNADHLIARELLEARAAPTWRALMEAVSLQLERIDVRDWPSQSLADEYNMSLARVLHDKRLLIGRLIKAAQTCQLPCETLLQATLLNLKDWAPQFGFARTLASKAEEANQRSIIHNHVLGLIHILLEHVGSRVPAGDFMHLIARLNPHHHLDLLRLFLRHHKDDLLPLPENLLLAFCCFLPCNPVAVELLLEHGASVNYQNASGQTALHILCSNHTQIESRRQVAEVLVRNGGADLTLKDNKGKTAFQCARKQKLFELVALLRKASREQTQPKADKDLQQEASSSSPIKDSSLPSHEPKVKGNAKAKARGKGKNKPRQIRRETSTQTSQGAAEAAVEKNDNATGVLILVEEW
ncbi:ankyrin repeat-containing domain protein [Microdochium trichocladiopsis]|uniref:Ankyrin repeat-containing domain protein n=1 Tax=Microdochium trichocladiopsis TaxID=1682393 RepID=A0A9P8XUU3_9PEZI|nr:ankyrin repeat-containing domain protein [Microdochium trichocladiopsis]KAH7018532.1 ankyrin repeat-containing domain protein [Microdochium trichocladiopsis]